MTPSTRLPTSLRAGLFLLAFAFVAPVAFGQMPQPDTTQLSSSDVSDQQVNKAAQIAVALQQSGRQMRIEMQKQMRSKYGNPQEMDSTQKAQMRKERRSQMQQMRKEQMKMMQQKTQEVGLSPQMFQQIMRSARQDSTLRKRLRTAMKTQMKQQRSQQMQGQGGGSGQ